MPPDIQQLADRLLSRPVKVEAAPVSSTAKSVDQKLYFVDKARKTKLLIHLLQDTDALTRVLVFTRTKHGANRVAEALTKSGIPAAAIHGNKSQSARQRALSGFKDGSMRVLVASDIAARGLDIDEVSHVFNFDLPDVPETYVHRIGRTGRAHATGTAIAFCAPDEKADLAAIERVTRQKIPVVESHPFVGAADPDERPIDDREPRDWRQQGRGRGQQGRGSRPQGGGQRPQNGGGQRQQGGGGGQRLQGSGGGPRPQAAGSGSPAQGAPGSGRGRRRRRRGGGGGGQGGGGAAD
jgi:ATP-dependent RNA helicase RhlE